MTRIQNRFDVNFSGHLVIGGCDSVDLVRRFGSPLYVLDEKAIRTRCRAFLRALCDYEPGYEVIYAGKALLTTAICRLMDEEGMALDVVSGGELYTALHADFPAKRIFFHGNNKSRDELEMAVSAGVGCIVVDSLHELDMLREVAEEQGKNQPILLRVTPGVEAKTHAHIQTGQEDSKFGLPMAGDALKAIHASMSDSFLELRGIHVHVGSQLMDDEPFKESIRIVFDYLETVRKTTGYVAKELNLGGGFGIAYVQGDRPPNPHALVKQMVGWVRETAQEKDYPLPKLMIEPGRSVIGEAGMTLYTIGAMKTIPGQTTYVAVDGGMADNPRVALYDAKYDAFIANRMHDHPVTMVTVVGKCCESGDMLLSNFSAPADLAPGDILAVMSTGAYNYSMASNYNRLPKPAMVLVNNGEADIIVKRETYSDLVRFDVVPDRLKKGSVRSIGD